MLFLLRALKHALKHALKRFLLLFLLFLSACSEPFPKSVNAHFACSRLLFLSIDSPVRISACNLTCKKQECWGSLPFFRLMSSQLIQVN